MKAELLPHGKCHYLIEGNIITIDATGPWNLEFFKQMHRELHDIVLSKVDIDNFAILLILQGDSLAVQDGLDYHRELVSVGSAKAFALNCTLSIAPAISESIFRKVYDQAGLKNKSFDTTETAKAWLLKQLS